MASGTDYAHKYGQAEKAYMQGNYQEAAAIVHKLIEDFPEDPSLRLLGGHIYCYGLQQYDLAREQYELVLNLTSQPDYINYANNGIEDAKQFSNGADSAETVASLEDFDSGYQDLGETDELEDTPTFESWQELAAEEDEPGDFDLKSLDFDHVGSDDLEPTSATPFGNPFGSSAIDYGADEETPDANDDPFAFAAELGYTDNELERFEPGSSDDFGEDTDAFGGADVEETGATFVMPPSGGFDQEGLMKIFQSHFTHNPNLMLTCRMRG
jgi:twitching motility protein PilJ